MLDAVPAPYVSVQTLVNDWSTFHGACTALVNHPYVLCIQVDRYLFDAHGQVLRFERPVHFQDVVQMPVFQGSDIEVLYKDYKIVAVITHQGVDAAGHCQSMLRTVTCMEDPETRFLLTQDGKAPERIWNEPWWLRSHAVCFWLCAVERLDLLEPSLLSTDTPPDRSSESSAFSQLMQALRTHETAVSPS